jgi:DNA-binding GntR family transcriptional regulator
MDAERLERLELNIAQYHQAIADGDTARIGELGHLFHREVNLAAGSHRLALLLGSFVNHLPNSFYTSIEGQVESARGEHPLLLAALRKRDARKARTLMTRHILEGSDHLIESLERRGLWAADEAEPLS